MKIVKTIIWALVIIVLGFFVLVGITTDSETSEPEAMPTPIPSKSTGEVFKEKFKEGYMEGCMENDPTMKPFCLCAYNYITNQVTEDELIDLSLEYMDSKQMPEKLENLSIDAAAACFDQYPNRSEQL